MTERGWGERKREDACEESGERVEIEREGVFEKERVRGGEKVSTRTRAARA
jgi:hypothetical protein